MRTPSHLVATAALAALLGGCAGAPPQDEAVGRTHEAEAAGAPRDAVAASVADALQQQGLISADEALNLVPIGSESGWTVMLTPGLPSATERLSVVAVASSALAPTDSPIARWSEDQWSTYQDTAGQVVSAAGVPVVMFTLASAGQLFNGTFLQAALRIGGTWLNAGGADYRITIASPYALSWVGDLSVGVDGVSRSIPDQSLFAGHDTTVTVDTYPMLPHTAATLHWTSDAYATIHDVPMALGALGVGAYGNDARWVGAIPATSAGATLIFWAEATSSGPAGTLWDSRNGQNYSAPVASPPAATWAQIGVYGYTTSQTGWYYTYMPTLADPLSATPGDYQAYALSPSPAVEVYVPGITDAPGGAAACSGGFVEVEAWSPFFSGTPGGAWTGYRLPFVETSGNNCRFEWTLQHTGYTQPPPGVIYPAGGDYPADGSYPYKLRVSTDGGATWGWLGTGGLPDGGENRTLDWVAPYHG